MAELIESNQVLEADSVGDVHPETSFERSIRVLRSVARGATLTVCICILFSANPDLAHYRAGSWGLLFGIAGAAIAKLFGNNLLPKVD